MADTGVVELLLKRIEVVDGGVDSQDVAITLSVDHQVVVGAVKSLQSLGDVSFTGAIRSYLLAEVVASVIWS